MSREIPQQNPVINNEYGWLWLNRDGAPTYLTQKLYENLLGPDSTTEQRFYTYATYLAAETEFFRAYRQCAAVMHFTMLTYCRTDGFTSDHWLDVEKLQWEPEFYQYVRDAFAPVGLMIEYWQDRVFIGDAESVTIPVLLINDLDAPWKGNVTLRLRQGTKDVVWTKSQPAEMASLGTGKITFDTILPKTTGAYRLEAELTGADGKPVRSVRDIKVLDPSTAVYPILDACASSINDRNRHPVHHAFDGDESTSWEGVPMGVQVDWQAGEDWIVFDFGQAREIKRLEILWNKAYATKYTIRVSNDMENWTDAYVQEKGQGGRESMTLDKPVSCRYVRMNCRAHNAGNFRVQISEFKAFER
jgi:hypothetical protein